MADISDALLEDGRLGDSVAVSHCGHPDESIVRDITELIRRRPDYWTLIISKKNNGHEPRQD